MYSRVNKENVYRGIYQNKNSKKWIASLYLGNRVNRHLGTFDNPVDAAKAWDKAAIETFGLSTPVNFPESKPITCWLHIFDMQPSFDRLGNYKPHFYDKKIGKFFYVGTTEKLEGRFTLEYKMGSRLKFIKSLPVSDPQRIYEYIESEFSPITRGFFDTAPDTKFTSPTTEFLAWATGDGIRECA